MEHFGFRRKPFVENLFSILWGAKWLKIVLFVHCPICISVGRFTRIFWLADLLTVRGKSLMCDYKNCERLSSSFYLGFSNREVFAVLGLKKWNRLWCALLGRTLQEPDSFQSVLTSEHNPQTIEIRSAQWVQKRFKTFFVTCWNPKTYSFALKTHASFIKWSKSGPENPNFLGPPPLRANIQHGRGGCCGEGC